MLVLQKIINKKTLDILHSADAIARPIQHNLKI